MNLPEPGLLWDPVVRRPYRLTAGPGGRGVRVYVDSDRPTSGFPPPRTSSRDNPLALPQQIPRAPGSTGGRGSSGNAIPPQPFEPYGASRPPIQHSQSASQSGTTRSLTAGVDRLSISETRPDVAQQVSRQQTPAARISGYQAVGGSNYLSQAQMSYHPGHQAGHVRPSPSQYPRQEQTGLGPEPSVLNSPDSRQLSHRQILQNQAAGRGGSSGLAQPNLSPYANAFVPPSQAPGPWRQVPSSQPNYTTQTPLSPYANPQGHHTIPGAGPNQTIQSPYAQQTTHPSAVTPTVAPGVPVAAGNEKRSQGSPPAGVYRKDLSNYEGETIEENITTELVRGTKGPLELLDPNFKVVADHWRFFVVGRVFKYLHWEPLGHGKPMGHSGNSLQGYPLMDSKLGEQAFAKVYRFVVVRARPKQGYSMCLRISTHNGHGTVGKLMLQREHSIIYTGEEAPKKFPEEKKLNKDPIRVIPVNSSEALESASRVNYAKPYPIEHNVKVCEVGMVTRTDIRKITHYYQQESGYETEREPRQRPERSTRRESSSSTSKEPERKVRRDPKKDNRRR